MDSYLKTLDERKLKPLSEDAKKLEQVLQRKPGQYTLGDFSSLSGLPMLETKYAVKELLGRYIARIKVTDVGNLIYDFGDSLKKRGVKTFAERWEDFKSAAWKVFKAVFKVIISIVLVIYFVVFLLILIAFIVTMLLSFAQSKNRGKGGANIGKTISGIFRSIFRFTTHFRHTYRPRDRWGYPYEHYEPHTTHLPRREKKKTKGQNPKIERQESKSFIASIYDFVFGPPRVELHPLANEMEVAAYLHETKSLISTTEVQALAGWTTEEAERFMTDCLTLFDGEARINENGTFYGEFYELTRTTNVQERSEIHFFWDEYEPEWELTGNKRSHNGWIIFMNIFNLAFSLFFIFNSGEFVEGDSILMIQIFLGWLPLLYSVIFFLVPLLRWGGIKKRQNEQHVQNIRKRLMRVIFSKHKEKISLTELTKRANDWRTTEEVLDKKTVDEVVRDFIIDMGGEGSVTEEGEVMYHFYKLNRELTDMELLRKDKLFDQELGTVEKLG